MEENKMTPKERLFNRLQGKPVDKVPNLNIVMLFAAKYANIPYDKFAYDYKYLVEAQTKTAVDFGIDILSTMSDPYREASDIGANIIRVEDSLPICHDIFIQSTDDIKKLKYIDPLCSTRMLDRIKAIELFKKENGDHFPILGWVEAPWAEFSDLASISEAMMFLYDDEDLVREALDIILKQQIAFATEQIKAGADIIGIGDAAASLVSKTLYIEFIKEYEQKLINAIHDLGAKTKLHICGNITHLLSEIITLGSDIIDIDYDVDVEFAVQLSGNSCSMSGNINPSRDILQGTPETVKNAVLSCLSKADNKFIISSGCEIPKMSPYENVKMISDTLSEAQ